MLRIVSKFVEYEIEFLVDPREVGIEKVFLRLGELRGSEVVGTMEAHGLGIRVGEFHVELEGVGEVVVAEGLVGAAGAPSEEGGVFGEAWHVVVPVNDIEGDIKVVE